MPTYEYRREDGTTFEIWQKITDDPLETCPETGQPVTRLISPGAGLIFKGSGFYVTDYARKNDGGKEEGAEQDSSQEANQTSEASESTAAE